MNVTGRSRIAGIFGWPVEHSRSPVIHNYWLAAHGIDGVYVPFAVRPPALPAALAALPALGILGVNLTIPHKEAALELLDQVDPRAARIGAVNTVHVDVDGRLLGYNSDGQGFVDGLRASCPDWAPQAGPAVVLGAGGAARAIVAALDDAGVPEIRIVNRTGARAHALIAALGGTGLVAEAWERRNLALDGAALLVNATSLGMAGQPQLEIALDALPETAVVADIVYVPLETPLLAAARARGHRVVDGLAMLLYQARFGFRLWFGQDPVVDDSLRDHVAATLEQA